MFGGPIHIDCMFYELRRVDVVFASDLRSRRVGIGVEVQSSRWLIRRSKVGNDGAAGCTRREKGQARCYSGAFSRYRVAPQSIKIATLSNISRPVISDLITPIQSGYPVLTYVCKYVPTCTYSGSLSVPRYK